MSPMRDGTNKQTTSEDRATQLLIWETLSLAKSVTFSFLHWSVPLHMSPQRTLVRAGEVTLVEFV